MLRKHFSLATYLIVIFVALLAAAAVLARLLGWQAFTVLSGSMEPAYPTGALIWVRPVEAREVKPGQVITFLLSESAVATHRVVEVLPDEDDAGILRFRTKGDSNESPDAQPVHQNNLIGTPVLVLPKLGYVLDYVRRPPGMYLALIIGAVLLICLFLPEMLRQNDQTQQDIAGNG